VSGGFTEDEIQNLKDIFDLFDKDRTGRIEVRDLEAIMTSLQRDPNEARMMLLANQEAAGSMHQE
jgi:Ca2+-binding EF-hand superfamily protein